MTALLVVLVAAVLLTGAWWGPRALGALEPTFHARPRTGMVVWASAAVLWTGALLAAGPLLAVVLTGPASAGWVATFCERCLSAAAFLWQQSWGTRVLVVVLLGAPLVTAGWLAVRVLVRSTRSRRDVRAHVAAVEQLGRPRAGHVTTWVVPSAARLVYSLPGRRGTVVMSQGALDALGGDELEAVAAHERAHVDQHHHLVLAVLGHLRTVVGWAPLVRAAGPAVAVLAEMAADDAARRASSDRALATALLALAQSSTRVESLGSGTGKGLAAGRASVLAAVPSSAAFLDGGWWDGRSASAVLHAAAVRPSARVRRIAAGCSVLPRGGRVLLAAYLAVAVTTVALVVGPYAALLTTATCQPT